MATEAGVRALAPLVRARGVRVAAAIAFLSQVGIGFLPTFAGPGYESALAAGIVLPSVAAVAAAVGIARARPEPFDAFNRGVAVGAVVFLAGLVAILGHGARAGFCDAATGLTFVLLGPGVGCLLAGAWGAVSGELAGRRKRRVLVAVMLALAGPAAAVAASLVRFYSSPMVFAFDPFVGYFSGTLYDTVVSPDRLVTYRAGSAATLFSAFVLALHLARTEDDGVTVQSIGRPGLALLGGLAALGSFLHVAAGPRLGHWQTRASTAEALGAAVAGDRCVVVHARTLPLDRVQRFARECEAHVAEVEAWLGAPGPRVLTAFLFADEPQKRFLMGASGTQVAKPWRAEIYLESEGYPHRILGHEVAHVVAAGSARGPLRIAGDLGGLLPNPGLIEGLAVAASPKDDDLSAAEWARAMKELELLPRLDRLFGLAFLGESSSRAYTASGAFVAWARERNGAEAIRRWYGGASVEEALGASLADLERAWHNDLDALDLPEAARVQARARFDRPPLFQRTCPRTVDGCRQRADALERAGDFAGARSELARARELDRDPGLAIDDALLAARAGDEEAARGALQKLAEDESQPRHIQLRAEEELGDLALAAGEGEVAARHYDAAKQGIFDEARLRTLEVKLFATRSERHREALVALLVGRGGRAPDRTWAAELLGGLEATTPDDGLAPYLLARWYLDQGNFEDAAIRLDRALARPIGVPRVRAEASRARLFVACGLGQVEDAKRALEAYRREPGVRPARLEAAQRFAVRCGLEAPSGAAPPPPPPAPSAAAPVPEASAEVDPSASAAPSTAASAPPAEAGSAPAPRPPGVAPPRPRPTSTHSERHNPLSL